jgi:uncharacterized protein (DUF305 family)
MKYLVLAALAVALAGCQQSSSGLDTANTPVDHSQMDHGDHGSMDHTAMTSSPGAADAPLELQFIDTMIVHHQGAVDMAKLVDGRTENRQLQSFADGVIAAQEREIAEMTRMRSTRFTDKPRAINMDFPGMRDGMSGMDMKELQGLSGTAFDLAFARQMISHHEGAVGMAKAVTATNGDPELRKLGETVIKDQTGEIAQLKKWISEWEKAAN